jgi:hypothetical protein
MGETTMKTILFALLLGLVPAAFATSGVLDNEFEQARVLIPRTNPPEGVAGATVLVRYIGSYDGPIGGHSLTICSRAWLTETDSQGWFKYPKPYGQIGARFTAYKRGYRLPRLEDRHAVVSGGEVYLLPWEPDATHEQRTTMFARYNGGSGCDQIGERSQPIADFIKILLPELREIAIDEKSKSLLKNYELGLRYLDRSSRPAEGAQ